MDKKNTKNKEMTQAQYTKWMQGFIQRQWELTQEQLFYQLFLYLLVKAICTEALGMPELAFEHLRVKASEAAIKMRQAQVN